MGLSSLSQAISDIKILCQGLDFLADPHIEEKMACSLDCCIGNQMVSAPLHRLIEARDTILPVVGNKGLQLLCQLDEALNQALYYDTEKGFSKTAEWAVFINLTTALTLHLQKSIAQYKDEKL